MKKGFLFSLLFFSLLFMSKSYSQLLVENFDFPAGDSIDTHGWTPHSGTGTTPVLVSNGGLTYADYLGSDIGNAADVFGTGEDVNKDFNAQGTDGSSIYMSALVDVTEAANSLSGGYFLHLGYRSVPTTFTSFCARVFVNVDASDSVILGLSNTSTGTYASTKFVKNTTYLLIVKYTINMAGNDTTKLWVVSSGVPVDEATAGTPNVLIDSQTGTTTDSVNAIGIRQSSGIPDVVLDGIRIGTSWSDIFPAVSEPGLSGDYYVGSAGTGPGGTDPQFATLRDAFQTLNDTTFAGNCTFYITSDILETFTSTIYGLGLAINPEPYTVTFKPYTGVQPVITLAYPTDGTSGPSGALIIGIPMDNNIAWNDLRVTKNIVIDGSNTVDGTTRDLTIECDTLANRNAFPLTIVGDVSNMVVKNTNIYYKAKGVSTSGNLFVSAVQVRSRNNLTVDFVPHDLMFENNHISANFDGVVQSAQGYGTYQSGTATAALPYNITLKNNLIEGKKRAISLYLAGNHDIIGNEIILNQNIAANTTNEGIYAINVLANSVVNIYNNKISKISSATNAASSGNTGISIETATPGTYNIYNNMIYGFELTAANPVAYARGIKNSSATAILNLNFNSIYMTDLADIGTGNVTYSGIYVSDGTNSLANNVVVSAEKDFANYCITRSGVAGTITSNHNDFYLVDATNGNIGFWDAAATKSLTDWQTASGQDANSVSKEVFFVSDTDLHLTGTSDGDLDLAGIPITGITTDIDGDTRNTTYPYMGADEGTISLTEPVDFWVEDFDYPDGDTLTNFNGWIAHSGAGTNPITINAFGLEFPSYKSSGIGLAALMDNTGEDVHKLFPSVSNGTVYTSFMVRVDAAPTGYFLHFAPNPHNTFDFRGRVWVKTNGSSGLAIGYSYSSSDTTFTSFNYNLGDTLLLISKYEVVTGDNNDVVSLYIFNNSTPTPSTEPGSPTVGPIVNATTSADIDPGSINLRQYSSGQNIIVDGIRVAESWNDVLGIVSGVEITESKIPTDYTLTQNYPNPFNPTTRINYSVPFDSKVTISVYSITGELVAELVNDYLSAGTYSVNFNGSNLASGMYIYRMVAGNFVQTNKMMLLK